MQGIDRGSPSTRGTGHHPFPLALAVLLALTLAQPALARPQAGCGRAFDLMTIEETLALVSDGSPNPPEVLLEALRGLDKNGDELVCVKDQPDTPGSPSYVRNVHDNTASAA